MAPKTPNNAVKVNINGTLGQGEVFSFGFWVDTLKSFTQASFAAANLAMTNAFVANSILTLRSYVDAAASYAEVRSYYYGSTAGQPAEFIASTAIGSGAGVGTGSNPLQTCVVASLRSAVLTGRGRGRMYIPFTGRALANHEVDSATCTTIANAVKSMLADASANMTAGSASEGPIVWSPTSSAANLVNNIIVDSRTDVQRRRAGKQTVLFRTQVAYP